MRLAHAAPQLHDHTRSRISTIAHGDQPIVGQRRLRARDLAGAVRRPVLAVPDPLRRLS